MDILQAIILGVVEGLTEFLPISSTGHLILATDLLQIPSTEFVKSFTVLIQSGAIIAVLLIYWRTFLEHKNLAFKVMTAFIPTAVIGLLLYPIIKDFLLGNTAVVLWALFIGGVVLILLEMYFKRAKIDEDKHTDLSLISYKQSLIIGVFQAISVIPGTSRALATIFGGLVAGLGRRNAVEFSFLLAIPTMFAATALDLSKSSLSFTSQEWMILGIGFVTSFIVAYFVIKWFIAYISHHTFTAFGVYRIIISIALYIAIYIF